ncbi:MAG: UvrB/UvrC motif-containing protein [Planctomycetaceae bacterium]|nr:UvrB/UvrC motif-containing protein [Planctomycetaceae bacterium]
MKKCRRCSKPATLHITEIREGKAVALHLCETCAREYLENEEGESAVDNSADLASKLEELVAEGSEEMLAALSCPMCGITFAEFRESGRFGCPNDYDEFMPQLQPLLENIHEDTTHNGKRPRHAGQNTDVQSRMIQLRKDLQEAVELEDYESAARFRDELAALEDQLRPRIDSNAAPDPKPKKTRRKKNDDE